MTPAGCPTAAPYCSSVLLLLAFLSAALRHSSPPSPFCVLPLLLRPACLRHRAPPPSAAALEGPAAGLSLTARRHPSLVFS